MSVLQSLSPTHPYPWPISGSWSQQDTALLVVDMQRDFLDPGGYFAALGNPLDAVRACIEPVQQVLAAMRAREFPVIFTREGHRPDLADLHAPKRRRAERAGCAIGSPGPMGRLLVRGEPGWDIIAELAPQAGEIIIDKPGHGAFYQTDLELILRNRGIKNLVLTGVTTEVCVHSTLREADDRGFDCLLVDDACAAGDKSLHDATVAMTTIDGGIFGATTLSSVLLDCLRGGD